MKTSVAAIPCPIERTIVGQIYTVTIRNRKATIANAELTTTPKIKLRIIISKNGNNDLVKL
jgi:hypothetical protein